MILTHISNQFYLPLGGKTQDTLLPESSNSVHGLPHTVIDILVLNPLPTRVILVKPPCPAVLIRYVRIEHTNNIDI